MAAMVFVKLLLLPFLVALSQSCQPHKKIYSGDLRSPVSLFRVLQSTFRTLRGGRTWLGHKFVMDTPLQPPLSTQECGLSSPIGKASGKVTEEARLASGSEFPWVLELLLPPFSCTGVLISSRHALTAAHCASPCSGSLCPGLARSKTGSSPVAKVSLHPGYKPTRGSSESAPHFDVAIVLLAHSLPHTIPACLPPPSLPLDGQHGLVVAWQPDGTIKATKVPILGAKDCESQPGGSRPTADQLCAGRSRSVRSPCAGDSGAPLMVENQGSTQWQVVGLVSHGPTECGLTPVTYAKLEAALPWINRMLELDKTFWHCVSKGALFVRKYCKEWTMAPRQ